MLSRRTLVPALGAACRHRATARGLSRSAGAGRSSGCDAALSGDSGAPHDDDHVVDGDGDTILRDPKATTEQQISATETSRRADVDRTRSVKVTGPPRCHPVLPAGLRLNCLWTVDHTGTGDMSRMYVREDDIGSQTADTLPEILQQDLHRRRALGTHARATVPPHC